MLYSLHFFDNEGRPTSWEELECASEAEAINTMLDVAGGRAVELWRGDHKLIWWPSEGYRRGPLPLKQRAPRLLTSV